MGSQCLSGWVVVSAAWAKGCHSGGLSGHLSLGQCDLSKCSHQPGGFGVAGLLTWTQGSQYTSQKREPGGVLLGCSLSLWAYASREASCHAGSSPVETSACWVTEDHGHSSLSDPGSRSSSQLTWQVPAALADILTATSWETLSHIHPSKPPSDSWPSEP